MINVRIPKFKIDDYVRVSKVYSSVFRKSYEGNWSKEIFRVSSIKDTYPRVTYGISDSKGEEIMGSYYENEMQHVSSVEAHLQHWEIDKILDTREVNADQGFGKTKQHLIRWKKDGKVLPDEFNEWVHNRQVPWTQRPVV